jgi:TrmH family RNA methyltransferase
VACSTSDAIVFLKNRRIRTFASALTAASFYHHADFTNPCAVILGSESDGLSDTWLKQADQQVKIPMNGMVDSLNVSTSAAILVYEVRRQRGFT